MAGDDGTVKQCHHGGSSHGGRLNLSQQPEAGEQRARRWGCSSWSGRAGSPDDDTACSRENCVQGNERGLHAMPKTQHQLYNRAT